MFHSIAGTADYTSLHCAARADILLPVFVKGIPVITQLVYENGSVVAAGGSNSLSVEGQYLVLAADSRVWPSCSARLLSQSMVPLLQYGVVTEPYPNGLVSKYPTVVSDVICLAGSTRDDVGKFPDTCLYVATQFVTVVVRVGLNLHYCVLVL